MTLPEPPPSAAERADEALDGSFMARALRLAEFGRATTHPNPRVGCVIVRQGLIVGEGFHERAGGAHAEVVALRTAGALANDAEAFVTLEPCAHHGRTPPCVDALIAARLRRVWVAVEDPDPRVSGRGIAALRAAGIEVRVGLHATRAQALNRGFFARLRRGRPWVTLKLASTLDGRTATASGESRWITGAAARADVHRLRAEAGAVLISSATVLADDPRLDVRDWNGGHAPDAPRFEPPSQLAPRQPDRIVLDAQARVPASARVWAPGARRVRITNGTDAPPLDGVDTLAVRGDVDGRLDLRAALEALAPLDVNEVLVECGAGLAGALLGAGLVDELVLYLAPALLGDTARPLAYLRGLERLDLRLRLAIRDARLIGEDLRIVAEPLGTGESKDAG